jgi:hypothetical protein
MGTKKIKYGSKDLAREFGALSFGELLNTQRRRRLVPRAHGRQVEYEKAGRV